MQHLVRKIDVEGGFSEFREFLVVVNIQKALGYVTTARKTIGLIDIGVLPKKLSLGENDLFPICLEQALDLVRRYQPRHNNVTIRLVIFPQVDLLLLHDTPRAAPMSCRCVSNWHSVDCLQWRKLEARSFRAGRHPSQDPTACAVCRERIHCRAAPAIFHASAGSPLFQQIFQILRPPKLCPDRWSEETGSSSPRCNASHRRGARQTPFRPCDRNG